MHAPAAATAKGKPAASPLKGKKGSAAAQQSEAEAAAWEERLKMLQLDAQQERCRLPLHMACPVPGCNEDFTGGEAWDLRMEHVAKHLDRAAQGKEGPVVFGGSGDATLMTWATRHDVGVVVAAGEGWVLNNPLKQAGAAAGAGAKGSIGAKQNGGGAGVGGVGSAGYCEVVVRQGDEEEDAEGEDDYE